MKRHFWVFAVCVSVLFAALYAAFYWQTGEMYNSPDENALAVFARHFAEQGNLTIERPTIDEIAHPRSVNIKDGQFVPGSFLGWLLFVGYAARLLGFNIARFAPAAVAVAGAWAYFGIVRRLFNEEQAWVSFFLLLTLPPWWYYASRGFMPNVAFVSMILLGVYGLIRAGETRSWIWSACGGLALGMGLAIRPNELVWIVIAALFYIRDLRLIGAKRLSLAILGALLPLLVVAYWQAQTFGHWYATGYQSFSGTSDASSLIESGSWLSLFFPFGLHAWQASVRFFQYQSAALWWFGIASCVGFIAWVKNVDKTIEQRRYTKVFLVILVYLLIYYGSWTFSDHPDQTRLSLGVSYGRYWLPIYVLALPYIAALWQNGARWRRPALLAVIFTLNTLSVYAFGDEHLGQLRRNIVEYQQWRTAVFEKTETSAVIISERSDKVFWPGREVIDYTPTDYAFLTRAAIVAKQAPLYLFTAIPRPDMQVIEQQQYAPCGLMLEYVASIDHDQSLYRVSVKP